MYIVFLRYRQAFLAVQGTMYRQLGTIHANFNQSPGAHSGPNFLGWHREFLKRLELAMRTTPVTVNGRTTYPYANVFIPYWNSAFDNELIRTHRISPLNSVMFSSYLMGSVRSGTVTDGIFGNFVGSSASFSIALSYFVQLRKRKWEYPGRTTRRSLDQWNGQVTLFSFSDIADIINNQGVNDLLGATAGGNGCPRVLSTNIELVHGDVHVWVGADMQQITTSTNDPIFFLHHSFIDSIWEQWRQLRQTRSQRESQWNTGPTSCYSSAHQFNAAMVPFT
ncbi:common central domain of tyrosinase [Ancylostoma ceylanicum]|uniref:Common central domain of tyrosinase n=1 Tax=Ancylostoma ceylanicum TaxID=53326 RepID=A0A0D6L5D9_9BILA|nr:common central domain of tyrosinase [Ancylostoma ceylanicum]